MQHLDTTPTETLARRAAELTAGIAAAHDDGQPPVVIEALREARDEHHAELADRGLQPCGVCPAARPGAVDHGCSCELTAAEVDRRARDFARIHD